MTVLESFERELKALLETEEAQRAADQAPLALRLQKRLGDEVAKLGGHALAISWTLDSLLVQPRPNRLGRPSSLPLAPTRIFSMEQRYLALGSEVSPAEWHLPSGYVQPDAPRERTVRR